MPPRTVAVRATVRWLSGTSTVPEPEEFTMGRKRWQAATGAVVAGLVAAVSIAPPAAGAAGPGPGPTGPVTAAAAEAGAFAEDVALVAARTGWSPAATAAHLQMQQQLSRLADQLARTFPARYAGAGLPAAPGGTAQVWFKDPVPPAAAELVAAAGIPVAVSGGRAESAAELRDRTEAVAGFLAGTYAQVAAAVRADGWVEATVSGGPAPVPELPPGLAARTTVTLATGPVVQPEIVGGTWLEDGNVFECTGGFTVSEIGTGVTGLATAGHCTGIDEWDSPVAGVADEALTFRGEHLGVFGDVQWHTSADVEPDDFYATATSIRDVAAVESWFGLVFGSWWCVYGRSSNSRSCDDVYSTFAVTFALGNLVSSLIAMRHDNTVGGDSGGTWSWGNTAAGVHQGDIWLPFRSRNVFSVADLLPLALGVTVRQ
jgi:hypothetical protein